MHRLILTTAMTAIFAVAAVCDQYGFAQPALLFVWAGAAIQASSIRKREASLMRFYSFGLPTFILVLYGLSPSFSHADSRGSLEQTEFKSANGKILLKITPHEDWPDHPASCKAELFALNIDERKRLWTRNLINEYAPSRVYVSNTGEHVVTMDEWFAIGQLPVVIYSGAGHLVEVHNLTALGLRDEVMFGHILQTVSNTRWNDNALVFFGPKDQTIIIRLHWGKIIVIDLNTGWLLDDEDMSYPRWSYLPSFIDKQCGTEVLRLLRSEDEEDRTTGTYVAKQVRPKGAIPLLRKLLTDKCWHSTRSSDDPRWRNVYYVRELAKEALESMGEEVEGVILEVGGSPASSQLNWGEAINGLKSRIWLNKESQHLLAEQIRVNYQVKNIGHEKQVIWHSGFWPNHKIVVLDKRGKEVPLMPKGESARDAFSPGGERSKNVPVELDPGQVDSSYVDYDIKEFFKFEKTGEYSVRYLYEEYQGGWEGKLWSNVLTIRVRDAN